MGAKLHGFTTPAAQTLSSHFTLTAGHLWTLGGGSSPAVYSSQPGENLGCGRGFKVPSQLESAGPGGLTADWNELFSALTKTCFTPLTFQWELITGYRLSTLQLLDVYRPSALGTHKSEAVMWLCADHDTSFGLRLAFCASCTHLWKIHGELQPLQVMMPFCRFPGPLGEKPVIN